MDYRFRSLEAREKLVCIRIERMKWSRNFIANDKRIHNRRATAGSSQRVVSSPSSQSARQTWQAMQLLQEQIGAADGDANED